jgi:glycine oxidase
MMPGASSSARAARSCVVAGGGVIGLSIARRLAGCGWSVTLCDRDEPGREASYAAAGMLCPRLEFEEDSAMRRLGIESLALYEEFAKGLEEETGERLDLRLNGILRPLFPEEEAAPPRDAVLLEGANLREASPGLDPSFRRALLYEREGSVDNRALTRALLASCRRRGVRILAGARVREVLEERDAVRGVRTEAGVFEARVVINAAGAWAAEIEAPGPPLEVRPIKGQMLLLDSGRPPCVALERTIYSPRGYLVPRSDGRVVVGTTVEDRGFDKSVEGGALAALLDGAFRLVPGLRQARFLEAWAGLRPRGAGELPLIGPHGATGYFVAAGHYRNGILLAPLTEMRLAEAVLGLP